MERKGVNLHVQCTNTGRKSVVDINRMDPEIKPFKSLRLKLWLIIQFFKYGRLNNTEIPL